MSQECIILADLDKLFYNACYVENEDVRHEIDFRIQEIEKYDEICSLKKIG
jgi:hypothetical protein